MDFSGSCNGVAPIAGTLFFLAAVTEATTADKFRNYLCLKGIEGIFESHDQPMRQLAKSSSGTVSLSQDWEIPFSSKGVHGEILSMDVLNGTVVVAGTIRGMDQMLAGT